MRRTGLLFVVAVFLSAHSFGWPWCCLDEEDDDPVTDENVVSPFNLIIYPDISDDPDADARYREFKRLIDSLEPNKQLVIYTAKKDSLSKQDPRFQIKKNFKNKVKIIDLDSMALANFAPVEVSHELSKNLQVMRKSFNETLEEISRNDLSFSERSRQRRLYMQAELYIRQMKMQAKIMGPGHIFIFASWPDFSFRLFSDQTIKISFLGDGSSTFEAEISGLLVKEEQDCKYIFDIRSIVNESLENRARQLINSVVKSADPYAQVFMFGASAGFHENIGNFDLVIVSEKIKSTDHKAISKKIFQAITPQKLFLQILPPSFIHNNSSLEAYLTASITL